MEVVLASGEVLRTGMGALPGARTWQQNKYGYGPFVDGLFKQSSLGVVTKMGIWLYPAPEAYVAGVIGVPKKADINALVDVINYLENTVDMQGMPVFASPFLPLGFPMPQPPGHAVQRRQRGGAGSLCGAHQHAVLDRHGVLLRPGRGREGTVGVYQEEGVHDRAAPASAAAT